MLTKSNKEKLVALLNQAISKAGDRPEVVAELSGIVTFLSDDLDLKVNISIEDFDYVNEVINRLQEITEIYVHQTDVNDIESLEHIKKELVINLMYLSSYKDKFLYEIEYLEDVFKKEIFSKLTDEISLREGISVNQAEKKVNLDERYNSLRLEITTLKTKMNYIKTKYDFFNKMIQVVVQSISVAGKEHYANRVSN